VQDALFVHLRILWCLLEKDAVPGAPSPAVLTDFNSRFATQEDIFQQRDSQEVLVEERSVVITRIANLRRPSKYAANASRLEEFWFAYFATSCARYGLARWQPDLRDTPYSLYNATHRIVAIDSFRQAVQAGAYSYMAADPRLLGDMTMLFRIYDQFVHHRQHGRYMQEFRKPGTLITKEAKSAAYAGRSRVSAYLLQYMYSS
jgi:hypothetical protein